MQFLRIALSKDFLRIRLRQHIVGGGSFCCFVYNSRLFVSVIKALKCVEGYARTNTYNETPFIEALFTCIKRVESGPYKNVK